MRASGLVVWASHFPLGGHQAGAASFGEKMKVFNGAEEKYVGDLELSVNVEVRQPGFGDGGLRVTETITLHTRNFLEVFQVLAQFHDLAEKLKEKP